MIKKFVSSLTNIESEEDSIDDEGETSAKNNSSVILELLYRNERFLFTADAGIPALTKASKNVGHEPLKMIQIPHHGSRRNIGPTCLNALVGNIVPKSKDKHIVAIVSCASKNPDHKHPNAQVLDAFTQRGCDCYVPNGNFLVPSNDAPNRPDY